MDMSSPEMVEILAAIQLPDKRESRARMLELWDKHRPLGEPLPLCSLAHALADTETDPADELEWDLRALEAGCGSREPEDREPLAGIQPNFFPSMHLSVAEGYRRLGDLERARRHVACAERRMEILPDDPYGKLVRGGLRRLQGLLAPA